MPVEKTKDNPHGWGNIEKRESLPHYQLSPRIQIVRGDVVKIGKGPYWVNKDGVKVSMDRLRGEWEVTGIFSSEGEIEVDVVHKWPGNLYGSTCSLRVTGREYPSPIVSSIIRRPYKIRLAKPRFKRKRRTREIKG